MGGFNFKSLVRADHTLRYRQSDNIDEAQVKKRSKDYPFNRRVNRLRYEMQITPLFDYLPAVKHKTRGRCKEYFGKITEIPAKIDFNPRTSCSIYAKTPEDLDKIYKKVLEILIKEN